MLLITLITYDVLFYFCGLVLFYSFLYFEVVSTQLAKLRYNYVIITLAIT